MQPYFETLGIIFIALAGTLIGWKFSCLNKRYWIIGYFIALLIVGFLSIGRFCYSFNFIWPFDFFLAGRLRFVFLTLAISIGLTSPLSRLPSRNERILVCTVMSLVITWFCVLPFLTPGLIRGRLKTLPSYIDTQGVCFQSTDYTCGPAAAVTALNVFGIEADEGRLAILAHTNPIMGTLPRCLSRAINSEYGSAGVKSSLRWFKSIDELKQVPITLAVVKDHFLSDHCVAVLEVGDDYVVLADPILGKNALSYKQFAQAWRFSGITLSYTPCADN